jgi:membrane associated rhomboid family serine protease
MRSARNAPATIVLAVALVAVYFGFQGGGLTLGPPRGIEFRCNTVEYGLIPYEITHPGAQLTDPFCQPQADDGHGHARSDPGLEADAPTWLTVLSSIFMSGGLLALAASVMFLGLCGPPVERRLGAARFVALFLFSGLVTSAALIAAAPDLPIVTIGSVGAVTGVIGAHVVLVPGSRVVLLGAWAVTQAALWTLDAAQPVAGDGGDVAYLVPAVALLLAVVPLMRARPMPRRAG